MTTQGVPLPGPSASAAGTDRAVDRRQAASTTSAALPGRRAARRATTRWFTFSSKKAWDRDDDAGPSPGRRPPSPIGRTHVNPAVVVCLPAPRPEYLGRGVRVLSRIVRHGSAAAVLVALLHRRAGARRTSGNLNTFITGLTPAQNAVINLGGSPTFQVVSTCKGMGLQAYISRSDDASTVTARSSAATSRTSSRCRRRASAPASTRGRRRARGSSRPASTTGRCGAVAQCEGDATIPWASQPVYIQVIGQTTDERHDGRDRSRRTASC